MHSRYIPSLVRAIERGADVATLRRIYAFQLALARPLLHEPRLLVPGAAAARASSSDDTETGYKFFRRERAAAAARRDRGPGLVLGHRVHGARGAARPARSSRSRAPTSGAATRPRRCSGVRDSLALLRQAPALPARAAEARVKALDEIGWRRALRFGFFTAAMLPYRLLLVPQLRAPLAAPARRAHRRAAPSCTTCASSTSTGAASPGLEIGDECFLGDECLLDLAEAIRLEAPGDARRARAGPDAHERRLRGPPAAGPLPRDAPPPS